MEQELIRHNVLFLASWTYAGSVMPTGTIRRHSLSSGCILYSSSGCSL